MQSISDVPVNANEHCPGVNNPNAGKSSACEGCPNQQACQSGTAAQTLQNTLINHNLSKVTHVILVLSGKGGVGKSTFASQLAIQLAAQNHEVGLLDIDICGPSIPRMLNLVGQEVHMSGQGWQPVFYEHNLAVMSIGFLINNQKDAIIWRGPRKNGLIQQFLQDVQWGELDYLVIDTPPGTSDEHISIVQMVPNAKAVVITTPQEVALMDVRKEISFCQKTNINILGVVENMSGFICPNCNFESQIFPPVTGGATEMCKDMNINLLGQIPLDPNILLSTEKGENLQEKHPTSKSSQAYKEIIQKIVNLCPVQKNQKEIKE